MESRLLALGYLVLTLVKTQINLRLDVYLIFCSSLYCLLNVCHSSNKTTKLLLKVDKKELFTLTFLKRKERKEGIPLIIFCPLMSFIVAIATVD